MESHLRKITQRLGTAVTQLEQVSLSEKTGNELDADWMTRFHAGISVPTPLDAVDAGKTRATSDTNGQDETGKRGTDPRWSFLKSTWLPLLQDLHRTVRVLDREESALQAAEEEEAKEAVVQNSGGDEAKDQEAAGRKQNRPPPRPPKGLLSLRDYTVIHAALEVVVHWGMGAVLEPGVGVFEIDKRPRSRAVKISRRVLHYWDAPHRPDLILCAPSTDSVDASTSSAAAGVCGTDAGAGAGVGGAGDEHSAYEQLALCAGVIEGVVTTGQFMPMLLPLYLPDLLAARLQLVYGRTAAASATATAPPANGDNGSKENVAAASCCRSPKMSVKGGLLNPSLSTGATSENTGTARGPHPSKSMALSSLRAVLKDVGPRQVMGALRHLLSQGGRAPPWLRQRAGRILSEIVLRPGGVQATLEVYLAGAAAGGEGGEGGEEGDEIKACLRVAKLLATPPKRVGSGDYVSRVAPQLAEMLHFDGQQRAIVTRVVVMIVGRLSESMPGDTRRLILFPLLRPLLRFWGPKGRQQARLLSSSRPMTAAETKNSPPTASSKPIVPGSTPPPVAPAAAASSGTGQVEANVPGAREEADRGGGSGGGGGGVGEDDIVSSEEELERCLEDLEKLLTAAPAPATLLGLLSGMGVAVPLFRLHCFCAASKSRNLQSTRASLSALLPSSTTAAPDLVAGLLPDRRTGWGLGSAPRFSAGPTGGAVLRVVPSSGGRSGGDGAISPGFAARGGLDGGGSGAGAPPTTDQSLLGMEAALAGLGLDPETLRLVGSAASAAGVGVMELGGEGGPGAGLIGALAGLKEAEGRGRAAAELLEGLGEGSPVAGKVFDMLLRRYLSLRDGGGAPTAGDSAAAAERADRRSTEPPTSDEAAAAEQHAVMASVVVLAERLGARVFGTGMQMLSCIRLVLEHEQPRGAGAGVADGGPGYDVSDGNVDAAARVARMEADEREDAASTGGETGKAESGLDLGLGRAGEEGEDGGDSGDTLCSVVLALLTTILELGEEERTAEEEAELRAMLGPLKGLAAGHRSAEVAEMSALLNASILSRGLSPEARREERERVKLAGGAGGDGAEGSEAPTAKMLLALDAAEEDLRSEAVPMRARGVVTLTRLMRATLDNGAGGGTRGGGGKVNIDTTVTQRLMDTFARMAGDSDSYVYLAAVQGLAALADALPGWCIPRLVGVFTAASGPGSGSGSSGSVAGMAAGAVPPPPPPPRAAAAAAAATTAPLPLSQRLKIGEAVLLSARRCGDAMPKYAHLYVNAFVVAARERLPSGGGGGGDGTGSRGDRSCSGSSSGASSGEEGGGSPILPGEEAGKGPATSLETKERYHFRASCLSNLAEVCQLLRWSLGRFSQDIVDLGVGVLSMETGASEEATLARRGASFLLGRLLRGAGGDVLQVVPAAELRAVYRALKRSAERDPDEVTRSHARNGLRSLDVAIRGQLFPAGDGDGGGGGQGGGGAEESPSTAHHPGITVL